MQMKYFQYHKNSFSGTQLSKSMKSRARSRPQTAMLRSGPKSLNKTSSTDLNNKLSSSLSPRDTLDKRPEKMSFFTKSVLDIKQSSSIFHPPTEMEVMERKRNSRSKPTSQQLLPNFHVTGHIDGHLLNKSDKSRSDSGYRHRNKTSISPDRVSKIDKLIKENIRREQ